MKLSVEKKCLTSCKEDMLFPGGIFEKQRTVGVLIDSIQF